MTVRMKDFPADSTPVAGDKVPLDSGADGCRSITWDVLRKAVLSQAFAGTSTATLIRTGADTYNTRKDNRAGSADPTVDDDETGGYDVGSLWFRTSTGHLWICVDGTEGAAVWTDLSDDGPLNNFTAVSDPGVNDDSNDGYSVGSLWKHVIIGDGGGVFTGTIWFCARAEVGAAVWKRIWPALAADISAATDSAQGVVELATSAETITGTDAARAVTPAGLQAKVTSTTVIGLVELATVAEAVAGTDTSRAVTAEGMAAHVAQPASRVVSGTTDTVVAGDIGNVVFVSQAAGCEVALNDMSGSLTSGRMMILTWQCEGAATILTVNPGTSVTIDGSASNYVAPTGRARVSLFSRDGLAWFSGTP